MGVLGCLMQLDRIYVDEISLRLGIFLICKTGCLGYLRVPFPEVIRLSQLGKLGFPSEQGGMPPYNPHTELSLIALVGVTAG